MENQWRVLDLTLLIFILEKIMGGKHDDEDIWRNQDQAYFADGDITERIRVWNVLFLTYVVPYFLDDCEAWILGAEDKRNTVWTEFEMRRLPRGRDCRLYRICRGKAK